MNGEFEKLSFEVAESVCDKGVINDFNRDDIEINHDDITDVDVYADSDEKDQEIKEEKVLYDEGLKEVESEQPLPAPAAFVERRKVKRFTEGMIERRKPQCLQPFVHSSEQEKLRLALEVKKIEIEAARINAKIAEKHFQIVKEHEKNQLEKEKDELVRRLQVAEDNILVLNDFIRENSAENTRMMEFFSNKTEEMHQVVNGRLEKAFQTMSDAVEGIVNSNELLSESMDEAVERAQHKAQLENEKMIMLFQVTAVKGLETSINEFDGKLKGITGGHTAIVEEVKKVYRYAGHTQIGLWIWRFVMFVMLLELIQGLYKVDNFWSWFKIFTGLALF